MRATIFNGKLWPMFVSLTPSKSQPEIEAFIAPFEQTVPASFKLWAQPQVLDIRDIWMAYQRASLTEKQLLVAIASRAQAVEVASPANVPAHIAATRLANAPCESALEAADAIEKFLVWADASGVLVVDTATL